MGAAEEISAREIKTDLVMQVLQSTAMVRV